MVNQMPKQTAKLNISLMVIVLLLCYGVWSDWRRSELEKVVENRHDWMVQITDEVVGHSNNNVTRGEIEESWQQLFKSNPNLRTPFDFQPYRERTSPLRGIHIPE